MRCESETTERGPRVEEGAQGAGGAQGGEGRPRVEEGDHNGGEDPG